MVKMNKAGRLRRLDLISLRNILSKRKQGEILEMLNKKLAELGEKRNRLVSKKQRLENTIAATWTLTGFSRDSLQTDALLGNLQRVMYFSKNCTWLSEVTKHCLDELSVAMPKLYREKDLAILQYQQFRNRGEMLQKQIRLLRAHMIQAQQSLESVEVEEQACASLASQV